MGYNTIADSEVAQDGPAAASTAQKFRDNLIACFAGDDTDETALRLEPEAIRNPTNSTSVTIAEQLSTFQQQGQSVTWVFFRAIIVVPGTYRLTGNFSDGGAASGDMEIYHNATKLYDSGGVSSGSVDEAITCVNGDEIRIDLISAGNDDQTVQVDDFQLSADYAVPMAQCQFATEG